MEFEIHFFGRPEKVVNAESLDAACNIASKEGYGKVKQVQPVGWKKPKRKTQVIAAEIYFGQMTQMARAYKGKFIRCTQAGDMLEVVQ
jgi:hypothetical protein